MLWNIQKKKLIDWLVKEENALYLKKVQEIKDDAESWNENFLERVKNAFTIDEAKQKLHQYIDSLPWKK